MDNTVLSVFSGAGNTNGEYTGVTPLPKDAVTAMAYVPFQTDTAQYTPEKALSEGTLYPNLNKPFLGGKCL